MTHSPRQSRLAYVLLVGCAALLVCSALAPFALAGEIPTPRGDVVFSITGFNLETEVGQTLQYTAKVNPDNSFELPKQTSEQTDWTLDELSGNGNVDPFTNLVFAVTNNALVPLLFTVSVTLPIAPVGPATLHGGSTGGTLNDANFNGLGSVSTSGGLPFYQGQIDGVTVLPIYSDPSSVSITFPGQSINLLALNPGLPGPTLPSGAALTTIGIINRFTLSPGDTFSGNSFFVVEPVPEPSTLALVGLALLAAAPRRRRQSSASLRPILPPSHPSCTAESPLAV